MNLSARSIFAGSPKELSGLTLFGVWLLLTVLLTWPSWINGSPLQFFDSTGYLEQGRKGFEQFVGMSGLLVSETPAPSVGGDAADTAVEESEFVRSMSYSAFAFLVSLGPFGLYSIALIQSAIVTALIGLLGGAELLAKDPLAAFLAAIACIICTPLPWFTSYVMPDIFAAVCILCAMLVVRGVGRLSFSAQLFVLAAATFATASHYGNLPLSLGLGLCTVALLIFSSRLSVAAVILSLAPVVLAVLANLGASTVVFDEPSVTPKRMPLLLVRSMEDGPAIWHLQAHCAEFRYAVCEIYDEFPTDAGTLLWSDNSIMAKATNEQMTRIRDEELLVIRRAFLEFPLQQSWSLFGNAISQIWTIGMDDFRWAVLEREPDGHFGGEAFASGTREGMGIFDAMHIASSILAAAALGVWAWKDGLQIGRHERGVVIIAVFGLATNALVFGGLSAPVDRYQSRVIWILPVLALLFWLTRRSEIRSQRSCHGI